jgi:hypothetical protein
MSSTFLTNNAIVLPLPSQTRVERIRDLYTDGYPIDAGGAVRPSQESEITCTMVGDFIECSIDDPEGSVHLPGSVTGITDPQCPEPPEEDDC